MPLNTALVRVKATLLMNVDLDPRHDGERTTRDEAKRLVVEYILKNPTVLEEYIQIKFRGHDARYGETASDE